MVTSEYVGAIMKLCQERRGVYLSMEYIEETRALIKYDLPLNEIIYDFCRYDRFFHVFDLRRIRQV